MKKTKRTRAGSWRRPSVVAAVLAIVAALAVAGCGGSSSSASPTSEEGTTSSSSQAAGPGPGHFEISEEARTCLKEHGLEPPEGGKPPVGGGTEGGPPAGFGGAGGNGSKLKGAFEACGIEGPMGKGKPGGAATSSAAFRTSVKSYVACVRENGFEMPEPNLSGEGPVFSQSEIDQEDPKFKAASEKCESILRAPAGSGTES